MTFMHIPRGHGKSNLQQMIAEASTHHSKGGNLFPRHSGFDNADALKASSQRIQHYPLESPVNMTKTLMLVELHTKTLCQRHRDYIFNNINDYLNVYQRVSSNHYIHGSNGWITTFYQLVSINLYRKYAGETYTLPYMSKRLLGLELALKPFLE